MKRILSSIFVIAVTLSVTVGLASSYFSDNETSSSNSFTAGSIDLLVNGNNDTSGLVNFSDFKPGDDYFSDPKVLSVTTNDAWAFLHIKGLTSNQGTQTEPEETEESQNGQRHDIENFLTYDLSIDGEPFVSFDDNASLPDMTSCWIPLGQIEGNSSISLIQSFHFDDAVTNWAQGDSLTFTEEFYAEQVRNNPNPTPPSTGSGRIWNSNLKKCIFDPSIQAVDTFTVEANNSTDTPSNINLENGTNYVIRVTGTANAGDTIDFDAKYSITNKVVGDTWTDLVTNYESYGPTLLNMRVNSNFVEWGPYNTANEYFYYLVGDGNTISMNIYDIYYPNNTGSLTVDIYELP